MKHISLFLILLTLLLLSSCSPKESEEHKDNYPGKLEIKSYKIGDKVDTTLFTKYGNFYIPNYLEDWTIENTKKLPEKYEGLPIAIWQLKSDSNISVTLLDDVILNISVAFMKKEEKDELSKMITKKFGKEGKQKPYEEKHPLPSWITYLSLETWETEDVIVQIGRYSMKNPGEVIPVEVELWNLVYSDFVLEKKIIDDYKKK